MFSVLCRSPPHSLLIEEPKTSLTKANRWNPEPHDHRVKAGPETVRSYADLEQRPVTIVLKHRSP